MQTTKEMRTIKEKVLRKMEEVEQAEFDEGLKDKELSLQEMLDEQAQLFAEMLGEVEDRLIKKIDEKMQLEPVVEFTKDNMFKKIEDMVIKELDHTCYRIYASFKAEFKRQMGEN